MPSQKSISLSAGAADGAPAPTPVPTPVPSGVSTPDRRPKRRRGHERVAALLAAATAEFVEKGYDAATMTAVAARAGAPIGSLYQFFANKEALAEALLAQYRDRVTVVFGELEAHAADTSPLDLGREVMDAFLALRHDRAPLLALMDGYRDPARLAAMRGFMCDRVAAIVRRHSPALAPERALVIGTALLQIMKAAATLEGEGTGMAPACAELRQAAGVYLAAALA